MTFVFNFVLCVIWFAVMAPAKELSFKLIPPFSSLTAVQHIVWCTVETLYGVRIMALEIWMQKQDLEWDYSECEF